MADLDFLTLNLAELASMPGGTTVARQILLQEAVAGSFVPQIATEGTGADVVEQISEYILNTGGGPKSASAISEAEIFGGIPESWALVALNSIALTISDGTHQTPTYVKEGVPFLSIKDVSGGSLSFANTRFITEAEHESLTRRVAPRRGDILFCRIGTLGVPVVVDTDQPFSIFVSLGLIRVPVDLLLPEYLALVLSSPQAYKVYDRVKAGGSHTNKLNLGTVKTLPIPIPPLAEQKRIVDAVQRLLGLFGQLEAMCAQVEQTRSRLAEASLLALGLQSDELALENLAELIHDERDLRHLEAAVRELAVRGRLTSTCDDDVPAKEFLSSMGSGKAPGTLFGTQVETPSSSPYQLPDTWEWTTLGSLLTDIEAGWSPKAEARPKQGDEWGVLKVSACSWGVFKANENKALFAGQEPRRELEVQPGDFLISRANTAELVARSVLVDETPPHLMLSDKTLRLTPVEGCNPRYLNLANLSQTSREHYRREATGTSSSMLNVSQKVIRRTPIPLPPSAEQNRIVEVVDRLIDLIRLLRSKLAM